MNIRVSKRAPLYCSMTEVLRAAMDLATEHKLTLDDIELRVEEEYGSSYAEFSFERPENDKERASRLQRELRGLELRRKQFKQLKKEFGE